MSQSAPFGDSEATHSWQNGCNGGGCKPIDESTEINLLSRCHANPQNSASTCFAWWGVLHRIHEDIKELKYKSPTDYIKVYLASHQMNKKIFDYKNSNFDPPESHAEIALNRLYWMFTDDNTNEIKFRDLWYSRIRIYMDSVGF